MSQTLQKHEGFMDLNINMSMHVTISHENIFKFLNPSMHARDELQFNIISHILALIFNNPLNHARIN